MYDEPNTPAYIEEEKRPLWISTACVFGIAVILLSLYLIFINPSTDVHFFITHGFWRPIILALTNFVALIAFIAIWRMRRWGVILLIAIYIFSIIYSIVMRTGYYWGHIPTAIIIVICLLYLKKMK